MLSFSVWILNNYSVCFPQAYWVSLKPLFKFSIWKFLHTDLSNHLPEIMIYWELLILLVCCVVRTTKDQVFIPVFPSWFMHLCLSRNSKHTAIFSDCVVISTEGHPHLLVVCVPVCTLEGNLSPSLSQIHSGCVVQNEPGKVLERIIHLHRPLPAARLDPYTLSIVISGLSSLVALLSLHWQPT